MKLYSMKHAINPQRTRIFLAEKGVDVEIIDLDIPSGETRTPEYLAINPRGTLPALVLDDGTMLCESIAICRYFEGTVPEPNLMGTTPKEMATIEMRQREMELDGMMSIAWIFRNTAPQFATRAQPGAVPDFKQSADMAARGQVLAALWFDRLNSSLDGKAYIAGERFTIADITAYCAVKFARWVKMSIPEGHRNTQRWFELVSQRPSMKA